MPLSRRDLIRLGALAVVGGGVGVGARIAAAGESAPGWYGPLGPPDANGVRVPSGFQVRVIGRTGVPVAGTAHVWHSAPDAGACFPDPTGGWIYVSNGESAAGSVSAVRFDGDGSIASAYTIASGTNRSCGGGATSWGTWLAGEEVAAGVIVECDPTQPGSGVPRPALGTFRHESAAEDPTTGIIYLTEDQPTGRLYRFVPDRRADLSAGRLEAAAVSGGTVAWVPVPADRAERSGATTAFDGGEGIVVDGPTMLMTTKGDDRIWAFDLLDDTVRVFYDGRATPSALSGLDQIIVHPQSRDLFVAEDGGNLELVQIVQRGGDADGSVHPFVQFVGHDRSEVTGPAFSPDGRRLYVSSQRGTDGLSGLTVEVSGPFDAWPEAATVSGRVGARRMSAPSP